MLRFVTALTLMFATLPSCSGSDPVASQRPGTETCDPGITTERSGGQWLVIITDPDCQTTYCYSDAETESDAVDECRYT